jgi:D-serine deaminase-like pyridoxal phosphate-dependent protein
VWIERLSEEHAVVRVRQGTTPLRPGDRVRVLPNHACPVSNLTDRVCLVDGVDLLDTLAVALAAGSSEEGAGFS